MYHIMSILRMHPIHIYFCIVCRMYHIRKHLLYPFHSASYPYSFMKNRLARTVDPDAAGCLRTQWSISTGHMEPTPPEAKSPRKELAWEGHGVVQVSLLICFFVCPFVCLFGSLLVCQSANRTTHQSTKCTRFGNPSGQSLFPILPPAPHRALAFNRFWVPDYAIGKVAPCPGQVVFCARGSISRRSLLEPGRTWLWINPCHRGTFIPTAN